MEHPITAQIDDNNLVIESIWLPHATYSATSQKVAECTKIGLVVVARSGAAEIDLARLSLMPRSRSMRETSLRPQYGS